MAGSNSRPLPDFSMSIPVPTSSNTTLNINTNRPPFTTGGNSGQTPNASNNSNNNNNNSGNNNNSNASAVPSTTTTTTTSTRKKGSRASGPGMAHGQLHGVFNPIRRTFTVPLLPVDTEMQDAIRDAIAYSKQIKPNYTRQDMMYSNDDDNGYDGDDIGSGGTGTAMRGHKRARTDMEGTFSVSAHGGGSGGEADIRQLKKKQLARIKSLTEQSNKAKSIHLHSTQASEAAQKHLVQLLRERDAELARINETYKVVSTSTSASTSTSTSTTKKEDAMKKSEPLSDYTPLQEKDRLELQKMKLNTQSLKENHAKLTSKLSSMEEEWKLADIRAEEQIKKQREELVKRKELQKRRSLEEKERRAKYEAEKEIRQKKREEDQKVYEEEKEALEKELKAKEKDLDTLNQTKSQMIWLLKEVIRARMKNKGSL